MISKQKILAALPPFDGTYELLADDQTVEDIMQGIKSCHKEFAGDYDLIYQYFIGSTPYQTCKNIFDFLRNSSFYYVEDEMSQTVRSPGGIVAMGATDGIDCKNYALFAGGILDAINRSGKQKIPYVYRFASDKFLDPSPCHVFIVAFPGTDQEIYIDPIPPVKTFNQRIKFYYQTDKKFHAMSLYKISGIGDLDFNWTMGDATGDLVNSTIANVVPFGSVALSALNLFSSPDNSQNWQSPDEWGYYLVKDPATHPMNNFLIWFQKHPGFLVNTVKDPNTGIYYTVQQMQSMIQNRAAQANLQAPAMTLLNAWNATYNQDGTPKNVGINSIIPAGGFSSSSLLTTQNLLIGGVGLFVLGKYVFKWF